jgi:hypothetical protein
VKQSEREYKKYLHLVSRLRTNEAAVINLLTPS